MEIENKFRLYEFAMSGGKGNQSSRSIHDEGITRGKADELHPALTEALTNNDELGIALPFSFKTIFNRGIQ